MIVDFTHDKSALRKRENLLDIGAGSSYCQPPSLGEKNKNREIEFSFLLRFLSIAYKYFGTLEAAPGFKRDRRISFRFSLYIRLYIYVRFVVYIRKEEVDL